VENFTYINYRAKRADILNLLKKHLSAALTEEEQNRKKSVTGYQSLFLQGKSLFITQQTVEVPDGNLRRQARNNDANTTRPVRLRKR